MEVQASRRDAVRIGNVDLSFIAAAYVAVIAWFSKGKQKFKE